MDKTAKLGRFDQSFIVKMITDFFILLLVVGVLELGVRFFIVLYDFYSIQVEATQLAADQLAADIRKIMINQGGPVAARTLYPILTKNHDARGLKIAIEPSRKTINSIKQGFDFNMSMRTHKQSKKPGFPGTGIGQLSPPLEGVNRV